MQIFNEDNIHFILKQYNNTS